MAGPTQTITVDRVSNSGNAIAQQEYAGKTVHVPAGTVGETYDVKLIDKGGYFVARLVDRAEETQPRGPSISPDTSDVGKDLLDRSRSRHNFEVRSSPRSGKLRGTPDNEKGQEMRSWMTSRKH